MEIKLKSYFIEIPDDRLNLFSKIKNKLDKNNLYDKIITDIQTIDIIDPKKFKSIKNDEKKIFKKENKLIGTVYYGKYGIERRVYNIENEEKEEITENEAIQDRYLYFINRFRDEKNSKDYIIFIIETKENKSPLEMFYYHFKNKYNLIIEAVTEKDIMEYFLKNSVIDMRYVSYKEKDVNNIFGKLLNEKEIVEIKPDIKKVELKIKLDSDLKEKEKIEILNSHFRSKISHDEYISLSLKNGRKIKITNQKVELDKYFYVEDVEKFYSEDGELLLEKIEGILDDNFEYIKNILIGGKNV